MERICEFCTALRPVVYCNADAAHLCLSCDTKVHSANTLSSRHVRTVLCDSCRFGPASVQCLDHQMFLCSACDRSLHVDASSRHQKRAIRSFMGCPSAKDFAALWGFKLSELENVTHNGYADSSTGQSMSLSTNHPVKRSSCFILQQIIDMKRVQLSEGSTNYNASSLIQGQQEQNSSVASSMRQHAKKLNENLNDHHDQPLENSRDQLGSTDINRKIKESPLVQDFKSDPFSFPFSDQLDHPPSSSNVGLPLHGEPLWQCRSPVQTSQLWSQNMQDLGVCEELVCDDDFNIPDVDLTFRNFEELFDQDPVRALLDDKEVSYSSMDKDMSHNSHSRAIEEAWMASSVSDIGSSKAHDDKANPGSMNYTQCPIRPSYSSMSLSVSRFSTESGGGCGGDDSLDSGISPSVTGAEPYITNSPELDFEARENAKLRYKGKKSRLHEKQMWYPSRKVNADVRKRVKGRFVKREGYDSDSVDVTRSY